jgi:hypothetical protein
LCFVLVFSGLTGANDRTIAVYKSATCGCCAKWIERLKQAGHSVKVTELDDLQGIKDQFNVPKELRSCHTAVVDGYVFEGHVPIDLISKIVAARPPLRGLAVPGMPLGSDGMEVPSGKKAQYQVIAFDSAGKKSVYAVR